MKASRTILFLWIAPFVVFVLGCGSSVPGIRVVDSPATSELRTITPGAYSGETSSRIRLWFGNELVADQTSTDQTTQVINEDGFLVLLPAGVVARNGLTFAQAGGISDGVITSVIQSDNQLVVGFEGVLVLDDVSANTSGTWTFTAITDTRLRFVIDGSATAFAEDGTPALIQIDAGGVLER